MKWNMIWAEEKMRVDSHCLICHLNSGFSFAVLSTSLQAFIFCSMDHFPCNILHHCFRLHQAWTWCSDLLPPASFIFFTFIVLMWPPWQSSVHRIWTTMYAVASTITITADTTTSKYRSCKSKMKRRLERDILLVELSCSHCIYVDGIHLFIMKSSSCLKMFIFFPLVKRLEIAFDGRVKCHINSLIIKFSFKTFSILSLSIHSFDLPMHLILPSWGAQQAKTLKAAKTMITFSI